MQIEIKNFGPIDFFEFDLDKDFIVTYGNNNIGKSYAMQVVYLLMKVFLQADALELKEIPMHYLLLRTTGLKKIRKKVERVRSTKDYTEEDVTEDIKKEITRLMTQIYMPDFMNSCKNTFGNSELLLENNPSIIIKAHESKVEIDLQKKIINYSNKNKHIILNNSTIASYQPNISKGASYIEVSEEDNFALYCISRRIVQSVNNWSKEVRSQFEKVYYLPASRSGIYAGMSAFGAIVAELSQNRANVTRKIEFPGISEPISDYFIQLSNINRKESRKFALYCEEIEDRILKGRVTFDSTTNSLVYQPNNVEAHYEMTEVSSMVSEISPIVAFLKYILPSEKKTGAKSILFIEEPEAHLHPNNQLELIRIFAELIELDVKLVVSSHSNYVFNQLNNLVLSKKLDYHKYEPIVLEEGAVGSRSKKIYIDELGADDENFIDVSERLYQEREEIISRLYPEEEE